MDDKEFTKKASALKIQFQNKATDLVANYQRKVRDITSTLEKERLSRLSEELKNS